MSMPVKDAERRQKGSQSERFIETARRLGCDEDEAAFDEKLKVIARQKPKDAPASKDRAPKAKSK